MNIKRKFFISTKKFFSFGFFFFLILSIAAPNFSNALVIGFPGSVNTTNIYREIENRYGFDQDIWRKAKRKESAPRVEIFFDNTNPKPGEKVTASAVPEFFKNDPQNLYYTWYIIHTADGRIQTATNSISDGKKEAAKLIARGDYDPNLDGQAYGNPDEDPDKDGWPAVDANSYAEDETAAPMGGADGVGGLAKKDVSNFTNADDFCDSLGKPSVDECNFNDTADDKSVDRYFTLAFDQPNHFCNECVSYFSQTKAKSTTIFIHPFPTSACDDALGTCATDECFAAYATCNKSTVADCITTQFDQCKTDFSKNRFFSNNEESRKNVSRCFKHKFGDPLSTTPFGADDQSGLDFPVECKHAWIDAPDYTSGSGKFPTGEEEYWKTDPIDPDTDGDGFPDGADVIGLGQENFSWNYQAGDRVGVAIEGTSMIPVDEKSAYFKIMWGYPDVCDSTKKGLMDKDECDESDDYGYGFLATRSPNEQGDDKLKISLSFSPDNPLADPSNENKDDIAGDGTIFNADQISVASSLDNTDFNPNDLYYTWQVQKGDLRKDDWGGALDIESNFNTTSPSSGMGISEFSFTPKKEALSGGGDIIYFKVTLTASKASDLKAGRGRSSVIIPVNKKGIKISLYKVDIKDGKAVVGDEVCNDGLYKALCPTVRGQMLAAKVSGSHYKSADSQFSWTVNGDPLYPPANGSQLFKGWSDTTVFFPITKEEQEVEDISVTATSKDQLQPVTGTRLATIVRPALFIKSSDTSVSRPKTYIAQDNIRASAYLNIESSNAFEALTNSNASYYLDFVPYYLLGNDANSKIDWSVNGTGIFDPDFYKNNPSLGMVELENNGQSIALPTGANEGDFSTLSAEVQKYWGDDERNIAYSAWGIAPDTLTGESSVSIEAVNAPTGDVVGATNNPGQILAAIGTHLPHYFMYLLRLVLTMIVMFIVSAGFYGVTQKLNFSDEQK